MINHMHHRVLLLAALTGVIVPTTACLGTETEVVRQADAVRLMGGSFVHDDRMAHEQTTYTWDDTRRGYVDDDRTGVVRFGRLRGSAYLAQFQALAEPATRFPEIGGTMPAGRNVYVVGLIRVSPPRVYVQSPHCLGLRDETPRLARSLGIEIEDSRIFGSLRGERAGIIAFFLAGLTCDPGTLDIKLLPQALSPGGVELAAAAAIPDPKNLVAYHSRRCDSGELSACHKLGQMYARGEGITADAAQAARLFERLCGAQNPQTCVDLALILDAGSGVARDSARATSLIKQACSDGDPYACELVKTRK